MKPEDPTDPQAWLLRAKSNLMLAEKGGRLKGVLADVLTPYAVQSRYPGWAEEVTREEYRQALELAARVVFWVESVIG